jgi:hypothetical protein
MVKAIFVNPIVRKRLNAHGVTLADEVLLASGRRRGEEHRELGILTSCCRGVALSWLPSSRLHVLLHSVIWQSEVIVACFMVL